MTFSKVKSSVASQKLSVKFFRHAPSFFKGAYSVRFLAEIKINDNHFSVSFGGFRPDLLQELAIFAVNIDVVAE